MALPLKARENVFPDVHERESRRRTIGFFIAILSGLCFLPLLAFGQTDVWLGGTGNWSDSTKWSAGVPASTSNVYIDNSKAGASVATINYNGAQCGSLTIDSDDSLNMVDGTIFTLFGPTISNAGTISLNSAGFGTYFNFSGAVTLSGGGTITMSNNAANYLMGYAQPGGTSVTNNSTIQGAGNIGWNGGLGSGNSFTNQRTINANQTTALTIGVGSGTFTNTQTLEATGGGTLVITGAGTLTNIGGTISAGPGSVVSLASGATISGGTLTTSGTGTIQANCCFNSGTLNGVTNNGTFQLNNGNSELLSGTITNNGSLQVNSTGGGSYLNITGAVTLKGSGTLTMSNNSSNYIMGYGQTANATLTNQSTIQGAGNIGWNGALGTGSSLVNKGTINANQSTPFVIGVNSGTFSNTGTLKVANGSVMYISGPGFTNFSGTTLALGQYMVNGTLQFDNANIVTNSAKITLTGSAAQITNQSAVNALQNFATNAKGAMFSLLSGKVLTVSGNVSNAGTLKVGAGSALQTGVSPNGTYTQTAGMTTIDGLLVAPMGVNIQAGKLFGKGTVTSTVQSSGSVTPGDSATTSGKLSISGTYTQSSKGSLNIAIGGVNVGTQYDQLAVTNGVSLSGTLSIKLIKSFVPAIGNTFTILTASVVNGTFSTVNGLSINSSEHFTITYNPTNVVLTVVSGP